MPSAILFDLDGTLVDSRADLATGVNLMRADFGLRPLPVPEIVGYVGNGIRKLVERAVADAPDVAVAAGVEAMGNHYLAHLLDETIPYPGVLRALETLAIAGIPMAVVTNKPEAPARQICDALGISLFVKEIIGGDTCPVLKPDPAPALLALERIGGEVAGSWLVGDNYTDLCAGRAAGLSTCFCRYGYGHARGESADLEVDTLAEFVAHVLAAANA
jgi:phosphoglycolate phosphatase